MTLNNVPKGSTFANLLGEVERYKAFAVEGERKDERGDLLHSILVACNSGYRRASHNSRLKKRQDMAEKLGRRRLLLADIPLLSKMFNINIFVADLKGCIRIHDLVYKSERDTIVLLKYSSTLYRNLCYNGSKMQILLFNRHHLLPNRFAEMYVSTN
jgi:hypothetical protein